MGTPPDGHPEDVATYVAEAGEFTRDTDYITSRITADGRDGYPVEPGRYPSLKLKIKWIGNNGHYTRGSARCDAVATGAIRK